MIWLILSDLCLLTGHRLSDHHIILHIAIFFWKSVCQESKLCLPGTNILRMNNSLDLPKFARLVADHIAAPIVYHNKHCLLFYVSFPSTIIYLRFCYSSFCWRLSWKSKQTKLPDWAPVRDCGSLRLSSKEISISNMSVKDESKIYSQNPSNDIYNGHKRWCEVFLMAVLSIPA